VKEYYDRRGPEYDDFYRSAGKWTGRDREAWERELAELVATIEALPPGRTLDVACGTGFLTRHLRGDVVGLDQSARMLDEARRAALHATFVQGDALALPFPSNSFHRVFTAHFYGHLEPDDAARFLAEARRVARELVVVDASRAHATVDEEWQERVLNDGSRWKVFKRYFTPEGLAAELGGGETLHAGHAFVVVRSSW
jgi:demethylmenaquinone methyltransferase/2-methoxy-6-polyprenyl-1,4-benzoquinol methylase